MLSINHHLKYVVAWAILFSTTIADAKLSVCKSENVNTDSVILNTIRQKFIEEISVHYNNLSTSRIQKDNHIKKYGEPNIIICANPHKSNQKVVYIEYEKNWWGNLYFITVKDQKILKWIKINTHGAITKYIRWKDDKNFFYEDSTHQGTRTYKLCAVKNNSVKCMPTHLRRSALDQVI